MTDLEKGTFLLLERILKTTLDKESSKTISLSVYYKILRAKAELHYLEVKLAHST